MPIDGQLTKLNTPTRSFWRLPLYVLLVCALFLAFGLLGLAVGVLYQVIIAPPKRLTIILLVIWDILILAFCGYFALVQIGTDMLLSQSKELLFVLVACGVIFQAMLSQYQLVKESKSKQVAYKSAIAALFTVIAAAGFGSVFHGMQIPPLALAVFALLFFVLSILLRLFVAPSFADMTKRMLDIGLSLAALMLLIPLFVMISFCVLSTGRPIFFAHERIGLSGKKFGCYKFRSMVTNAQEVLDELLASDPEALAQWQKGFKLKNDPRVTGVGHFLRRTSLDEMPQLWNVLKGDMSLVGPRPITETELIMYKTSARHYLKTKPGLTGVWQISGRSDMSYEERVTLDRWYARNWSVISDLGIILKTTVIIIKRRGAY